MIGTTVSHYNIIEKLGDGGMGVVYRAEDTRLNRTVALKFLPSDLAYDDEAKARFLREAQSASTLLHPNICVVYDIDESDDGRMFICMEHLEGETLKKRIERGPLKLNDALDLTIQIAQGLARAHERGIVHRDIKPANIIVTTDGTAKIVDFGLAKLSGQTILTRAGSSVGTPAYMSPEQADGGPVDQRSDIWSLGAVLYEMLTGRRPFEGEYENALIYSILNSEPEPVTALRSGIPMDLERIVHKCMAKSPESRYQRAAELLVDLRSCLAEITAPHVSSHKNHSPARREAATTPRRKYKPLWYAGASVAFLTLAFASWLVLRPHGVETSTSDLKMIAVLPFENLGAPEEESFADGMTEEIASRLGSIGTLGVISRQSTIQYKKSTKPLPAIAQELGVDFILSATIRWVTTPGAQRIRITPHLYRVKGDVQLWAENIDRTLDDIFSVQTEIAMRVVDALNVVLGKDEKMALGAIPTSNLDAYQAYLRGVALSYRNEESNIRTAIEMFQRAVELDSTFALAYAQLAYVELRYFWYGHDNSRDRVVKAKLLIDKAFALSPDMPDAQIVLGYYYYFGFRDYDRALAAFALARTKLPNDERIRTGIAFIHRRQGKMEQALEELKKGLTLNPRNGFLAYQIGITQAHLGLYPEAESSFERSISFLPDQSAAYVWKSDLELLWRGDTAAARRELERIPTEYFPTMGLVVLDVYRRNYRSALDRLARSQQRVFAEQDFITPAALLQGLVYRFMDNPVSSHAAFDSARVYLETEIARHPDDDRLHTALGVAYAGLGRNGEALREVKTAETVLPLSKDVVKGTAPLVAQATVFIMTGDQEAAIDQLEFLLGLHTSRSITVPLLRLDPIYDPLRGNPRFQALLKKYQ